MTALLDRTAAADGGMPWGEALALLQVASEALASIPVEEVPAAGVGDALLSLRRAARVIDAVTANAGRRFASSDDWALDGAASAPAWLHGRGNDTYASARTLIERGRFLDLFPVLALAWRDGEVSGAHVDALRTLHRRHPHLQPILVELDAPIAVVARACEAPEFHQKLRELCYAFDPSAVDESDRQKKRLTYLHVSTILEGFVRVDGMLDPVLGAQLIAVLESARRDVEEPSPSLQSDHAGSGGFGRQGDSRSQGQAGGPRREGEAFVDGMSGRPLESVGMVKRPIGERNLDALQRILDGACAATGELALPLVTGERPTINVTVPLEGLTEAEPAVMGWLERFGMPVATVTGSLVQQIACDASVRPLVVDRKGQLVAMLPRVRTIHSALRRAVFMRDRRCRFPHCKQRIDEVHHIQFHSQGGLTQMSNLVGLCWFHHHTVHDKGWSIEGDPGGRLRFSSRSGRSDSSDPPPLVPH